MERRRSAPMLLCVLLIGIPLATGGCYYKQKFNAGPTNYGTRQSSQAADDKYRPFNATAVPGDHRNDSIRYDSELSNRIGRMPGIHAAIVITSASNAYAAIILDKSATGAHGKGILKETDNRGTTSGMYDASTGSSYADPNEVVTGRNSLYTVRDPDDLSTVLKRKVSAEIRTTDPRLRNVHISANRDFINEINFYKIQSLKGADLNVYVQPFNEMANKYFPGSR